MPRHYRAELRRQACERMLAGELVKDLIEQLDITRWRPFIAGGARP